MHVLFFILAFHSTVFATSFAEPIAPLLIPFDADVPADLQKKITLDLEFLSGIEGTSGSKLHEKVFGKGGINGASYSKFLKERITAIGLDDCGGSSSTVACVKMKFPFKMWITRNFIQFNMPQISRSTTLLHEARHTEIDHDFWKHEKCPNPFFDVYGEEVRGIFSGIPMAGSYACDEVATGSYGVGAIFLKSIQKHCSNCTEKVKLDAELYGNDTLRRIIDHDVYFEMKKVLNQ